MYFRVGERETRLELHDTIDAALRRGTNTRSYRVTVDIPTGWRPQDLRVGALGVQWHVDVYRFRFSGV